MAENNTATITAIDAFGSFLDKFFSKKSYVLNDEIALMDKEILDNTYAVFCSNSLKDDNTDKKFDDVIKALIQLNNVDRMIDVINHAVWLWCLPNDRKAKWIFNPNTTSKKECLQKMNNTLMNIKGVAGGGSGYVQTKTNGVRFILFLFTRMVNLTSVQSMKDTIIDTIVSSKGKYKSEINEFDVPDGVKNLLLHLCDNSKYAAIASTADKERIVRKFWEIIETDKPSSPEEAFKDLDNSICKIKKELSHNDSFSFYENSLPLLWKGENAAGLSLVQQLEYKKAMILYGPPGTSKSFTANELAVEVIFRYLMRKNKNLAIDILKNNQLHELNERIKYLQFHINFNYEDFIAGQTIEGVNVKTKKGFIYDVIEKSNNKFKNIDQVPFVVILDEINRTDISRVFGELFSAIEKRGKVIDLMLPDPDNNEKRLQLCIPDNIYFIGTMNEIDFSLERIDFALRRRFIWELHDFDKEALDNIILFRLNKAIEKKIIADYYDIVSDDFINYYDDCVNLNKKVKDAMGEAYHVGHTFFADIANIYVSMKDNGINDSWKRAKKMLWEISIKPTLEAYCGTMDKSKKEEYLKDKDGIFTKAFFGEYNATKN